MKKIIKQIRQNKLLFILTIITIVSILMGILFPALLGKSDTTLIKDTITNYITNIKGNKLNIPITLVSTTTNNVLVTVFLWLLGISLIGIPIIVLIIFFHGFLTGFSLSSILITYKLKGLLRFMEVGENLYYASLHPEHHILEPLGHHFMNRLPNQDFIIHDKNRELCFLYHNRNYEIVDSHNFKIPEITVKEKNYQDLWKMFFKTIAISERKNSRCQMQFMPKKYWKDLVEMN